MTSAFPILPPGSRIVEIKAKPVMPDDKSGAWKPGPAFALVRDANGRLSEIPASTGREEDPK